MRKKVKITLKDAYGERFFCTIKHYLFFFFFLFGGLYLGSAEEFELGFLLGRHQFVSFACCFHCLYHLKALQMDDLLHFQLDCCLRIWSNLSINFFFLD